jgi:threonylcarbamoyladenosine tRNA methylthiotransferase MtaB
VERLPLTGLHVFPYSLRPGTPAERLRERVDGATIARRARELR